MEPNWKELKEDCLAIHGCSEWKVSAAKTRSDKREYKRVLKKNQDVLAVMDAAEKVFKEDQSLIEEPQKALLPILAILLPYLLPFMRSWLISAFQKSIIDWIIKRLSQGVSLWRLESPQ